MIWLDCNYLRQIFKKEYLLSTEDEKDDLNEPAEGKTLKTCRLVDKAASRGIIHNNQAANRKSGVMKLAK